MADTQFALPAQQCLTCTCSNCSKEAVTELTVSTVTRKTADEHSINGRHLGRCILCNTVHTLCSRFSEHD